MNHFYNCHTIEEIKTRHRALSMQLHPDKGGNPDDFRVMQEQYEQYSKLVNTQPKIPPVFHVDKYYEYYRKPVRYTHRDNHYHYFTGFGNLMIDSNNTRLIFEVIPKLT